MKIVFTVNLAIQYSLILNEQQVRNRLLSFVHFHEGGSAQIGYYAEHGHFQPSERSKYRLGLDKAEDLGRFNCRGDYITGDRKRIPAETLGLKPFYNQDKKHGNDQSRRSPQAPQPLPRRPVGSVVHPGPDAHQVRRRARNDVQRRHGSVSEGAG